MKKNEGNICYYVAMLEIVEELHGTLGPIKIYKNIVCLPMQKVLALAEGIYFKGGPIFPDWDEEPLSRHFVKDKPVDHKPDYM